MIKYSSAYTSESDYIHVESLDKDSDRSIEYLCLGCDQRVFFAIPKERSKHFKHKDKLDSDCPPERHAHYESKKLLFNILNRRINDRDLFIKSHFANICEFGDRNIAADQCITITSETINAFDLFSDITVSFEKSDLRWAPNIILHCKEKASQEVVDIFFEITIKSSATRCIQNKRLQRVIELIVNKQDDLSEKTFIDVLGKSETHNLCLKRNKCGCIGKPVITSFKNRHGLPETKEWRLLSDAIDQFERSGVKFTYKVKVNSCLSCRRYVRVGGNTLEMECCLDRKKPIEDPGKHTCEHWKIKTMQY